MPQNINQIPWEETGWQERSQDWILQQLVHRKLRLSAEIQQLHVRPWSTVLLVPTQAGNFYFKASAPSLNHEARLTQALATWQPGLLPKIIAVEPDQSWLLMNHGGPTLRSLLGSGHYLDHWHRVMSSYAHLQIDLARRQDELLQLGAMDRRLATLPALFEDLINDRQALLIDQPDGLSTSQYQSLVELVPTFSEMCARLADYGLPETLQHDDFHDNNIFVPGNRYLFFDWGETCVAHPFFTLTVTLRSVAYQMKLEEASAAIDSIRDLYLEAWSGFLGWQHLHESFELARVVGMANRSLTWYRVVAKLPEPYRSQEAEAVPGWLIEFLEAAKETL